MNLYTLHNCLLLFGGSFLLSLLMTPLVRNMAVRSGKIAIPQDSRWHKKATPFLGGVSIYFSFIIVWIIAANIIGWENVGQPSLPMIICASGIFVLGLADDLYNMMPQHKLAGQIVFASLFIIFGYRLQWTHYQTIDLFLSILWIVGITNAFNLLDNMDGLSAGIALIAGIFLFTIYYLDPGQINVVSNSILLASVIFIGALLGFLVFNFNPASIFMGDAGSLFIGFMLACLTSMSQPTESSGGIRRHLLSVIAIPILIVFIPILDTGFVSVMRKLFGRSIAQGGKDHSSHRLVAIGFSERKAVLTLYILAIVSGLIALAVRKMEIGVSLVVIVLYLLVVLFFWLYLAKVKVYPEASVINDNGRKGITPILINITYRRRLLEVMLDLILITVAYYSAYLLRFEGEIKGDFDYFLKSLPILIACQIFWFFIMGVYRGFWERASLRDVIVYVKAVSGGTVMAILIIVFQYRFYSFSRAVFVIYWFLMLILLSLARLSFRLIDEEILRGNMKGRPTLIYGAGVGGQMTLSEMEKNRELNMAPIGFIDDDPKLHHRKLMGYPVLGGQNEIISLIHKYQIKEIVISFKQSGNEKKREIQELCFKNGAEIDVRQMNITIR